MVLRLVGVCRIRLHRKRKWKLWKLDVLDHFVPLVDGRRKFIDKLFHLATRNAQFVTAHQSGCQIGIRVWIWGCNDKACRIKRSEPTTQFLSALLPRHTTHPSAAHRQIAEPFS